MTDRQYLLDHVSFENGKILSIEDILMTNPDLSFTRESKRLILIANNTQANRNPYYVTILERLRAPILLVRYWDDLPKSRYENNTVKLKNCPDRLIPFDFLLAMTKYWDKQSPISQCFKNFKY